MGSTDTCNGRVAIEIIIRAHIAPDIGMGKRTSEWRNANVKSGLPNRNGMIGEDLKIQSSSGCSPEAAHGAIIFP